MKKCPYCAEEIQEAAKVCKHCGLDLKTGKPPGAKAEKKQTSGCTSGFAEGERPGTWQCDKCGEHIEEQFDACWKCSGEDDAPPSEGLESFGSPIVRRLALALGTLILLLGLIGLYGFLYGGVGVLNPIMTFIPTLLAVGFLLLILGAEAQAAGHPISLGFFVTGVVLLALGQIVLLFLRGSEDSFFGFILLHGLLLAPLPFGVLFTFVGGSFLLFFRLRELLTDRQFYRLTPRTDRQLYRLTPRRRSGISQLWASRSG